MSLLSTLRESWNKLLLVTTLLPLAVGSGCANNSYLISEKKPVNSIKISAENTLLETVVIEEVPEPEPQHKQSECSQETVEGKITEKCFFSDGKLKHQKQFIKDEQGELKLDGQLIQYYHSGAIMSEGQFEKGRTIGTHKAYHSNGKLKKVFKYSESGHSEKHFDSKGRITYKGRFDIYGREIGTHLEVFATACGRVRCISRFRKNRDYTALSDYVEGTCTLGERIVWNDHEVTADELLTFRPSSSQHSKGLRSKYVDSIGRNASYRKVCGEIIAPSAIDPYNLNRLPDLPEKPSRIPVRPIP